MNVISPLPLLARINAALVTKLSAIIEDGANYSITPGEVKFVEDLNVDKLPSNKSAVIWILDGDVRPTEKARGAWEVEAYYSIFSAWRNPVPYPSTTPSLSTVRTLMIEDIHRALTADVTLGGLARNTEITEFSRDIRIDNTTPWTGVSAFVVVRFRVERFS